VYIQDVDILEDHIKKLKKRYKIKSKPITIETAISNAFDGVEFNDFGDFMTKIHKTGDEWMYKKLSRNFIINRQAWGPSAADIQHEGDLADTLKGTLFLRLATAIVANSTSKNAKEVAKIIQRDFAKHLKKSIKHVVPKKHHKELVKNTLEEVKTKLGITDEEINKIVDIFVELGEMLHEAFPNSDEINARIANAFSRYANKPTSNVGQFLLENFPELKEAIEKHSDRITQLADELAELRKKREAIEEAQRAGKTVAVIEKKEPSMEDLTIETLKGMGVDLKLETGNIAERKANIYSWLKENGLIKVEERDGRKIVRPTEKLHALVGKHGGNVAAAMIKWAAEEGVGLEHVEPVAKILAALEEYRQIAKKQDPKLAKALEKAMRNKHTVRELVYVVVGMLPIGELSEKWRENFGLPLMELLRKKPELTKAFLGSMENLKELASFNVPLEWLPFLEAAEGDKDELREALNRATLYRMTFSAYESLAIRGLPKEGREIVKLMIKVLERARSMVPEVEVFDELREEVETLAELTALMKDCSYLEVLEAKLAPLLEKVPETRKVGLFKRESPRRKVEDFATLLMEGNLSEDEAERKAGELKEYLKGYLASEEVEKLVAGLMLPFRGRKLLEKHGTAEGFLFEYAHAKVSRCLLIEAHLAEAGDSESLYDTILRTMVNVPSVLGTKRMTLKGFEHNISILRELAG